MMELSEPAGDPVVACLLSLAAQAVGFSGFVAAGYPAGQVSKDMSLSK